jgi:hypothetical protein
MAISTEFGGGNVPVNAAKMVMMMMVMPMILVHQRKMALMCPLHLRMVILRIWSV